MSSISLTFNVPNPAPYPLDYGQITIVFNNGSNVSLIEKPRAKSGSLYQHFHHVGNQTGDEDRIAANFATAFLRDYRNVGGKANITASVVGNVVTLEAVEGTFSSFSYSGNVLYVTDDIENSEQKVPLNFNAVYQTTGNCTVINSQAACSGGTQPYTLYNGTTVIESGWDGSTANFTLPRGTVANMKVIDSVGDSKTITINVPRKLAIGEFKERKKNFSTYSDILIENVNPVTGTTPIQYSLDESDAVTGDNYQTSNSFPGVSPGTYKLFVKDRYGCEVSKTIVVTEFQDTTEEEVIRYFDVPEGQSVIFQPAPTFDQEKKKNYFNTGSYNQDDLVLYNTKHYFDVNERLKGIQFKSSYDYHIITFHECGTLAKTDIAPIRIQENLGVTEKMDCFLFAVGNKTGVYFQGGNTYVANTTTVLETNTYNGSTPRWAEVGQLVFLDGLGGFYISATGYDGDRGGYFVIDVATPETLQDKVQLTYNRHDYNLYEFFIDKAIIDKEGFIIMEKGFDDSSLVDGDPWVSEKIVKVSDTSKMLYLEWWDSLNKGDIVFQSGIYFFSRLFGEFEPIWENVAETESGDARDTSIQQKSTMDFEVLIEAINKKQVTQLNIASALEGFTVNNLNLVRKKEPEIKRMGKSNLYTWKCQFGYGDNKLAVKEDEIVLEVSTGVIGGGGTGKYPVPTFDDITLYRDANGNLLTKDGVLLRLSE